MKEYEEAPESLNEPRERLGLGLSLRDQEYLKHSSLFSSHRQQDDSAAPAAGIHTERKKNTIERQELKCFPFGRFACLTVTRCTTYVCRLLRFHCCTQDILLGTEYIVTMFIVLINNDVNVASTASLHFAIHYSNWQITKDMLVIWLINFVLFSLKLQPPLVRSK